MANSRRSYEDSCQRLQPIFVDDGMIPPMPGRMPRHDDEGPLGVSFFRTFVGPNEGKGRYDLSHLTLPRTFFGRSEVNNVLFVNTDLAESNLCWNDFIDVEFSDASLARSDMRASIFERVNFSRTDLREADMRRSTFPGCTFADAVMAGAVLTRDQAAQMQLSAQQQAEIAWTENEGEEPPGG